MSEAIATQDFHMGPPHRRIGRFLGMKPGDSGSFDHPDDDCNPQWVSKRCRVRTALCQYSRRHPQDPRRWSVRHIPTGIAVYCTMKEGR